jgi:hypothetical protein
MGVAAALLLALLIVPAALRRVDGPDAWWLFPFVMLAVLSAGGLLVLCCERRP